ncbi:hypothetical protein ASG01_01100 [Chryseobacterium sp. Leaf180]|uniref:TIGR01777 family oxidoreductase n=1 Tax=Chryseobacterium sp. Leaf180 TaxID=1736289 RepID=UPI0006FB6EF7|nr:TIGR01777 family oxidoreductase [Chryseobacterium sp. Leaf180]KQR94510.1 hypothetical protein ASG01_01100 [Chryseobacterium sp. Leaf180]
MKETILITGANGSVAKNLSKLLQNDYEIRFLTRTKKNANEFEWNIEKKTIDVAALKNVSHIIHLAGANVAEKKWTDERKKEIFTSRIDSAKLILDTLKQNNFKIKSFISASASGIYGSFTSEKIFDESGPYGNDFLAEVVKAWEAAADDFKKGNIAERVVKVRTPIVLAEDEGALKKMSVPVKMGFGSPIGSGKQYMPWVHINDLSRMYKFAVESEIDGAYNVASPEHVNSKQFTKAIAKVLDKPMFMPNVPAFMLKLIFGELSVVLLEGSRISSEKLQKEGFKLEFPNLDSALRDLLLKKN